MAAARASFSTTTGRPSRDSSAAFSGKSRQPRLTASVTVPCAGSTRPGTPTPTARSSARSRFEVASASSRQATIASAAPSWSPTEEDRVARPRTAPEASTTRTAILVPPMSTPATRPPLGTLAVVSRRLGIAGPSARARWSAAARSAPTSVRSSPLPPSTIRVSRASGPRLRRVASSRIASSHGSPRTVTEPWTTMWRTSRMPIRFAMAEPSARPAARVTPSARSSPRLGRGGQLGEGDGRRESGGGRGPQDRGRRGDRLEAAEAAAVALGAVGLDDDVADLARAVAVAAEEVAVEDEAGADAAPDLDRDEVGRPVLALEEERGQGRGAGVVGDDGRVAVALVQEVGERAGPSTRG